VKDWRRIRTDLSTMNKNSRPTVSREEEKKYSNNQIGRPEAFYVNFSLADGGINDVYVVILLYLSREVRASL